MGNSPEAEWEAIGPELAEKYLANLSPRQRQLSESKVESYADQMAEGDWLDDTGEAIQFDGANRLLNGRHRLTAVCRSGMTIRFLVVRGVAPEAFSYIDVGAKRAASQFIEDPQRIAISQAAGLLMAFEMTHGAMTNLAHLKNTFSIQQIIEYVDDHPQLVALAPTANAIYKTARIHRGTHLALMAGVCSLRGHELNEWCLGLEKGAGLLAVDPRLVLRDRWLRDFSMLNLSSRERAVMRWAFLTKAWNAHLEGKSISILRYLMGDPLPVPKGVLL